MADTITIQPRRRELAYRSNDGVEVALLWSKADNSLTLSVLDARTGNAFELAVENDRALDAFYHPFAYAARRGIEYCAVAAC